MQQYISLKSRFATFGRNHKMRFSWSKRKETDKSVSRAETGVQGVNTTCLSDHPAPIEHVDPAKPGPSANAFPPHPAVAPLQDASTTAGEKMQVETKEDLTRSASTPTQSTNPDEPGENNESKYIKGLPLHLLTLGLTLTIFVIALDNTIIATAIPRITTVFNSLDDVGWYGSSYLLTTTCFQPSFGKVYTFFNLKWTFILALVIFEVGSVLCGAAINSPMLIIGRAVAGVGAAGLFSGGMTIIAYSVPLRRRPIYIGLLSSMFGIASVVGPILGGAFTDRMLNGGTISCDVLLTSLPRRVMAMVLLHQSSNRRHCHCRRVLFLQEPRTEGRQFDVERENRPD